MKQQSLRAVIRLRQLLVEEAGRHLAGCLHAESEATEAVRLLAAEINHQRQAAEAIDGSDADVEAFMAWLRRERGRLDGLSAAQERAAAQTTQARAQLMAARAALETVASLHADAARAGRAAQQQAEQRETDEIAGRARGGPSLDPASPTRATSPTRPTSDESSDGIA